jgi:prephenate dehydrogenase
MDTGSDDIQIGIVGCGLIGTSLALLVKRRFPNASIRGLETNPDHLDALRRLLPDAVFANDLAEFSGCKFTFICTPSSAVARTVCDLAPHCGDDAYLVDTGSVKGVVIADVLACNPGFDRFVPGHPLAGGPTAGPAQASIEVLDHKPFVLTPYRATSGAAVAAVSAFLSALGLRVYQTTAARHDRMVALTSHVTHVIAYCAVNRLFELWSKETAGDDSVTESDMLYFVGGSLLGTTRFASANPAMWAEILKLNEANIRDEAHVFADTLRSFIDWVGKVEIDSLVERLEKIRDNRLWLEQEKNEIETSE